MSRVSEFRKKYPSTRVNISQTRTWGIPVKISLKSCYSCEKILPASLFNKNSQSRDRLALYCRTCERNRRKDDHLETKYGITEDCKQRMVEIQGYECPICYCTLDGGFNSVVDHDHVTGVVRQILCRICNAALGSFREDPEILQRAVSYLLVHRGRA